MLFTTERIYVLKVSIVVIIYKVGEYVRQCVESIMNQTYKNIEIICVVGNTDEVSMNIVDELAKKDERIKFIPRNPDGVSNARNAGLSAVTGDLIGFVDGDDYIDEDMIETLVNAIEKENADISIIAKHYLYKNTIESYGGGSVKIMNTKDTMEEVLLGDGFFLHLWDKLYKKELFDGISFAKGAVCEDRQVCYDLLMKSNKTVFIPESKYYFRQSLDSTSKIYKNAEDSLSEDIKICNKLLEMFPELKHDIDLFLVKENISMIQSSFLYEVYSAEHDKKYRDFIKKHMFSAMKCKHVYKGIIVKMFWASYFPKSFGKMTIKRRQAFLESHEHFSNGNDWEKIFKEQGIIK